MKTKLLTTLLILLSMNSMGQERTFDFSKIKITRINDDMISLLYFNATPQAPIYSVAVNLDRIIVSMDTIKYTIYYTGTLDSITTGKETIKIK